MLRLVGFFFACILILNLLRSFLGGVPVIGALLGLPLIGFWIVALLLSAFLSKLGSEALDRRRQQALMRSLGAVDTPHNCGKLGSLLVSQGRYRRALPLLEKAIAGEPEVAEWPARKAQAAFALGRFEEALDGARAALDLDQEYGYGRARMLEVRALAGLGREEEALERLALLERFHGPSPESAYRRGVLLSHLGRKEQARAAFDEVESLAREAAHYQRREGRTWVWRARWARLF